MTGADASRVDTPRKPGVSEASSSGRKIAHVATRPALLGVAAAIVVAVGLGVAWVSGAFANDHTTATRTVDVAGTSSAGSEVVSNEGVFVDLDGSAKTVILDQPLPADLQHEVDAHLASLDPSAPDFANQVAEYLGTSVSMAGKPYVVIYPAHLSCDGETYFDGFAVRGDGSVDDAGTDSACEQQKTLDGARALASAITKADPSTAGTWVIFETHLDDAKAIYKAAGGTGAVSSDAPTPHEQVKPTVDPKPMTEDEKQTYGGDV